MSYGARGDTRRRFMRRGTLLTALLAFIALLFLASGHWIIGVILAVVAAVAIWILLQLRTVR